MIAIGLAFLLNNSGKPMGFSILVGAAVGIADYALLVWIKRRGKNNEPKY
jgi:hypothetical protein